MRRRPDFNVTSLPKCSAVSNVMMSTKAIISYNHALGNPGPLTAEPSGKLWAFWTGCADSVVEQISVQLACFRRLTWYSAAGS